MKVIFCATVFTALASLLIPQNVKAQSLWCQDYDDVRVCVPLDTINQKGSLRSYVQYKRFASPDERGVDTTVASRAVDCVTKDRFSYRIVGYTTNGQVVFEENKGVAVASPAPPGSLEADVANFVCR